MFRCVTIDAEVKGYKVYLHFNSLNPQKAAGRNLGRYAATGRFLDLTKTSFKYGNKPKEVFDKLVKEGKFDGYSEVSADVPRGSAPQQLRGTEQIDFNWRGKYRTLPSDMEQTGRGTMGSGAERRGTGFERTQKNATEAQVGER